MLFCVGLLSAGAMGLWHGVEYYEKEKIVGDEYYQQWSNVSFPTDEQYRLGTYAPAAAAWVAAPRERERERNNFPAS